MEMGRLEMKSMPESSGFTAEFIIAVVLSNL